MNFDKSFGDMGFGEEVFNSSNLGWVEMFITTSPCRRQASLRGPAYGRQAPPKRRRSLVYLFVCYHVSESVVNY
ncbi:hypothetical protein [Namhaeicola litoreus]|uniref:hypothetical protein n=1 Tax=Namhaeicola litoreus TaxID=1052145 RepID=UPI00366A6F02